MSETYEPGEYCKCGTPYKEECTCGAEWRTPREIELEKELKDLKEAIFHEPICRWQSIEKMKGHPHGLYLVLYKEDEENPIDSEVPYNVQERYFTYIDGKTCFQSEEDAKGAIAFTVPRFYPSFDEDTKRLVDENRKLQKTIKELKESGVDHG